MNGDYHIPVLLQESIGGLNIQAGGVYVDATYGGGGHSRLILSCLGPTGRLYGFDQDEDAEANIVDDPKFVFVRSNFSCLSNFMDWHGVQQIDGLLADLGVSSHHFDDATRGFSFRFDGDLDMRMNRRAGKTSADILNTTGEEALADIFYLYGELKNARAIARAIVKHRASRPMQTVNDFLEILKPFFGREKEKKYMAQAFQALRIEVNGELQALKDLLVQAGELLRPGGRLVVITYHSLEDRIVKNYVKTGNFDGKTEQDFFGNIITPFKAINSKVTVPSDEEIAKNPRSRSAKLRIAEKK
jgi:16S rRNA (cytosine1402-N4)-methyltransferase